MPKCHTDNFALFGGEPAFTSFRTTMNLVVPDREVFFEHALKSFQARHFSNNGPALKELEQQLADFHHVAHCIAFCNCFVGMFLALRHLALPGKQEVIVPSLTYRRMADIIDWAGLIPCFCDVDPVSLAITPKTARPCITDNTALILAPHPITHLCDIEGMEALAQEYALPLVFDSVEACGGSHEGVMIGSFGLCESFSMHSSKVLNSCEGGYITTNDDSVADVLRKARAYGFSGRDTITTLGLNAKLNELHAAMGLASLAGVEEQLAENKALHHAYQEALSDIPGICVIEYAHTEKRNWKSLLLRLDTPWPFSRDETLRLLNAENIHARAYYAPPQHQTFPRQAHKGKTPLPVTECAAKNHMILPFGSTVSHEDVHLIGQVFRDIFSLQMSLRERLEKEPA